MVCFIYNQNNVSIYGIHQLPDISEYEGSVLQPLNELFPELVKVIYMLGLGC